MGSLLDFNSAGPSTPQPEARWSLVCAQTTPRSELIEVAKGAVGPAKRGHVMNHES